MNWAVFLDRDGVLTDAPMVDGQAGSPSHADDLVLLPGAIDAVAQLRAIGARTFVVTNQPDVARGRLDARQLDLMHQRLGATLAVDEIVTCPHDGADGCACRKPLPGMLRDLAARWDIALDASFMVGDRWVDIAAGAAAGATTLLVEQPYSWQPTSAGNPPSALHPDHQVVDVVEAAHVIARLRGSPS